MRNKEEIVHEKRLLYRLEYRKRRKTDDPAGRATAGTAVRHIPLSDWKKKKNIDSCAMLSQDQYSPP